MPNLWTTEKKFSVVHLFGQKQKFTIDCDVIKCYK